MLLPLSLLADHLTTGSVDDNAAAVSITTCTTDSVQVVANHQPGGDKLSDIQASCLDKQTHTVSSWL